MSATAARDVSAALTKARSLIGILPRLVRHRGEIAVVEPGGTVGLDEESRAAFAGDIALLRHVGLRPVVVHGDGLRPGRESARPDPPYTARTDRNAASAPETADTVRMVFAGRVQHGLVGLINRHGPLAVGITGEDADTFTTAGQWTLGGGGPVDTGGPGGIVRVNPGLVRSLVADGRIPVISAVARGAGRSHPLDPGLAAAALAAALGAGTLTVLTGTEVPYRPRPAGNGTAGRLTARELEALLPELDGGLLPAMTGCLHAVRHGVGSARVVDGRVRHAVLTELLCDEGTGTVIVPDGAAPTP
ncbi:acetylglutamate kinase [Streptomyces sp. NPDC059248]|uniref:acetylglutamate kinase n=1 Tax=Streptomyces sp. NPDC059248 TaxID=3346791 RepID=UPI0036755CAF